MTDFAPEDAATLRDLRTAPDPVPTAEVTAPEIDSEATELSRLAALTDFEYARERVEAARRFGIAVPWLDREVKRLRAEAHDESASGKGQPLDIPATEPWRHPVDGAELLSGIAESVRRYVFTTPAALDAAALWCLHSHALDAAMISPRLAITSPEKRCGKTTLLAVVGKLVLKPLAADSITAPALFRTIELARPTLLVDEADTFLAGAEDLRGVVNSGHRRGGGVIRTVGDDHEPRRFSTWAALAIACIGRLPDTITDRAVSIALRRRLPDEQVERFRNDRADHLHRLARMAARWAADNFDTLTDADPECPTALHDRAADNWRPLFAIADAAGGDWPERARRAALALSGMGADDGDSVRAKLLADIKAVFTDRGVDRLPSAALVEALVKLEDRPWPEWKNGKPLSVAQLAALLRPFGIAPGNLKQSDGRVVKGYRLDAMADVFARYLAPQAATPLPGAEIREKQADSEPLPPEPGSGSRSAANPRKSAKGSEVAAPDGESDADGVEELTI